MQLLHPLEQQNNSVWCFYVVECFFSRLSVQHLRFTEYWFNIKIAIYLNRSISTTKTVRRDMMGWGIYVYIYRESENVCHTTACCCVCWRAHSREDSKTGEMSLLHGTQCSCFVYVQNVPSVLPSRMPKGQRVCGGTAHVPCWFYTLIDPKVLWRAARQLSTKTQERRVYYF